MNPLPPEMLHCLSMPGNHAGNCTDTSVLDRQRGRMKWQHEQQQQHDYYNGNDLGYAFCMPVQAPEFPALISSTDMALSYEFVTGAVKDDPGLKNAWPDFGQLGGDGLSGVGSAAFGIGSGFEMNYGIARTTSCPPAVAAEIAEAEVAETKQRDSVMPEKMSCTLGRESLKKRKADKNRNLNVIAEDESMEKRIKGCTEEEESKITEENSISSSSSSSKNNNNNNNKKKEKERRETSADASKEMSKISEVQKTDYIHVRARRGQATDSHSLAERVRREKISERMKYLQDIVPGCNKITGKAGMLDEIINYVQSLQRQVEFLSMKVAAVNPTLDVDTDNIFAKEMYFPACTSDFPLGLASKIINPACLQFNPMQKLVQSDFPLGLEMGISTPDMALGRTIMPDIPIPETFQDSSCFSVQHIQPIPAWDTNAQSLYGGEFHQEGSLSFSSQHFTGSNEASNLKMEM